MARACRSDYWGASVGLVPPVGNRMVGRFTDKLIWSVQKVGNTLNSGGWWTRFVARRFRFKRLSRKNKRCDQV